MASSVFSGRFMCVWRLKVVVIFPLLCRYVNGKTYMEDVADALEEAKEEIFITDWWWVDLFASCPWKSRHDVGSVCHTGLFAASSGGATCGGSAGEACRSRVM